MSGFHRPRDLPELYELARSLPGRKRYLAGGTDLNVQVRASAALEEHLICIWGMPGLSEIDVQDGYVRIGACASIARIVSSPVVRELAPFLVESLALFASPQIRSMATVGGNIANGSPTADTVPPLLVLGALLEISSAEGSRRLPLARFHTGYKRNALGDGEILRAVLVPSRALDGFETFYRKVGARATMTIAKLSVAAATRRRGEDPSGLLEDVRVAVGSLNEYPRRLERTEALLQGSDPRAIGAERVVETVRSEITPISDFRSDAAYREAACLNLILSFLGLGAPQSAVPE